MEQCGSASRAHPWKAATTKRKAWALSRSSWQASESQDGGQVEGQPPQQEPAAHKVALAEEPGRIPNKIASWLQECRTPLGASLDDQSNTPTKGTVKATCSFEDDLSLGAEANHLRAGRSSSEMQHLGILAQEKRMQFQQKGRSMNSTGSGKSNTTVSSVSELLDLYEEDPEEILYNLGFGREEPDIASKIPSRFFNSTSHARGIDIKVYLGAQLQRLELENPNYALTSRFRQIEVLTTVANAFSSLYSQVSGTPVQKIGSTETEQRDPPPPLCRNNSALNAAKILKKTVTRRNLHAVADGSPAAACPEVERGGKWLGESGHEQSLRTKELPLLATVTEAEAEESRQGQAGAIAPGNNLPNGGLPECATEVAEEPDATPAKDSSLSADPDTARGKEQAVTSTPAKEPLTHRPHPCISHLLSQAKDSFEMEEVQSNEGEGPAGVSSSSREGNELLQRMASQHSDSSGFAEDPSTDGSANHLKVQESSDSCDSETTVTSNAGELSTPLVLDHPVFQNFPGEADGLAAFGSISDPTLDHRAFQKPVGEEEGPMAAGLDGSRELNTDLLSWNQSQPERGEEGGVGEEGEVVVREEVLVQENVTEKKADQENVVEEVVVEKVLEDEVAEEKVIEEAVEENVVEQEMVEDERVEDVIPEADPHSSYMHELEEPSSPQEPGCPAEPPALDGCAMEPGSADTHDGALVAPCWPPQTAPACEDHGALVWARVRDLQIGQDRHPLRRASSLPTSLLNPSRVVSSVKILLRPGSARHCTPPTYSYRYTPEDEGEACAGSIEEKEEEEGAPCRSTLVINIPPSRMPPYPPQHHLPAHLTRSSCSLHSSPPDWFEQPLSELPRSWSTCSMPALSAHSAPYGMPRSHPHSAPYSSTLRHPHSAAYGLPLGGLHRAPYGTALGHGQSSPYSAPLAPTHSDLYGPPYSRPHSAPFVLPLGQSISDPYSSPLGHPRSTPHNFGIPQSNRCSSSFRSPYGTPYSSNCCPAYPAPCGLATSAPVRLAHPPSSAEMQLKRVLHDVRSAVQNLAQSSSRSDDTVTPMFSPHHMVQPLYEDTIRERQVIKRNLNVFRTQMMDLELALLRQQDMVYQHLTEEDRLEAEHLQSLRNAVRQELQELELQLEDHLLFLEEQLRTSHYRHPVGLSRGHSLDSRSSTPPMNVAEPMTELLNEQLSLQAELAFEGWASSAPPPLASSCSSESVGPARPSLSPAPPVPDCPSPPRTGVYRTSISLTPALPPRQRVPGPPQRADSTPASASPEDGGEGGGGAGGAGGEGGGENPHLQQLIEEIKRSITEDIRQKILSDLLAAVLSRRSPVPTQEDAL